MALKNMAAASRASEEDASLAVKVTLGVCSPENARLALLPVSPAGSHMPAAALMLASPSDDAPSRLSDLVADMLEVPPEFSEFNLWSGRIPRLEQGGPGLDYPALDGNEFMTTWPSRFEGRYKGCPPSKRRK